MKSSKNIRPTVVKMIVMFNINNNCHKRHTQKPFLCASEMSFSSNRRWSSSVAWRFTDSTADGGRCYTIRVISMYYSICSSLTSYRPVRKRLLVSLVLSTDGGGDVENSRNSCSILVCFFCQCFHSDVFCLK
jgi:hypothetical protein